MKTKTKKPIVYFYYNIIFN